jgi:hypothetical protein
MTQRNLCKAAIVRRAVKEFRLSRTLRYPMMVIISLKPP